MTTKQDYTDEEWQRLIRGPFVAGLAISIADPGGPFEAAKEVIASLRVVAAPPTQDELVVEVSREITQMGQQRQNPVGDFRPKGAEAAQQILDELRSLNAVLRSKATPEEAGAFRSWIVSAAQAAADAAKEGGFMGFGAEQVSEGERQMLEQVRTAIGETDAPSMGDAASTEDAGAGSETFPPPPA